MDFLILSEFAPLLEGHPVIDRLIQIDRNVDYWGLNRIGRRLDLHDYDLVIDLHNTLRSKLIRARLRIPVTLVYEKPRWQRFLLFRLHRNLFPADYGILEALNAVLDSLIAPGIPVPLTELYVSDIEKKSAGTLLKKYEIRQSYICLIPGAAWPQKQWSPEKYAELAQRIIDTFALDVVLLGTLQDSICDKIRQYCPSVKNLKGLTSLRRSMAIVSNSVLTIGNDTGLTHIAEALGIRALMILGPTAKETGAGHNLPDSVSIGLDIYCRPCSQHGQRPCYREEQYCLTQIMPELIFDKLHKLLPVA